MNENLVTDYGWDTESGPDSCGYIAPKIIDILRSLQVKRVADIGAGNGALCREMRNAGMYVIGVEYDQKGVEVAKRNNAGINFYNYGVQDNPQDVLAIEQPFDAVVSTEVVEHLFSPHLLPTYAKPLLKKGGHLVISTPYHGYLKNCAIAILGKWDHHHTALWHGGHIKFWSVKTLTQLLEENGFRIKAFHGVGRLPFLWKSMILVAEKT